MRFSLCRQIEGVFECESDILRDVRESAKAESAEEEAARRKAEMKMLIAKGKADAEAEAEEGEGESVVASQAPRGDVESHSSGSTNSTGGTTTADGGAGSSETLLRPSCVLQDCPDMMNTIMAVWGSPVAAVGKRRASVAAVPREGGEGIAASETTAAKTPAKGLPKTPAKAAIKPVELKAPCGLLSDVLRRKKGEEEDEQRPAKTMDLADQLKGGILGLKKAKGPLSTADGPPAALAAAHVVGEGGPEDAGVIPQRSKLSLFAAIQARRVD